MTRPRSRAGGGPSSARDPLSLALDLTTPPEVLAQLARTRNRSVLRAVAMHPHSPPPVVFRLGFRFPEILAAHPAFLSALERAEDLAAIPSRTLRSLLRIPLLSPIVMERLSHHPSAEVRRLVAERRPDDGRRRLTVVAPPEEPPTRPEKILRMRFGIGVGGVHTLEEVGTDFTVVRERIRCVEAKVLQKLKHPSRSAQLREFIEDAPAFLDGTFSWIRLGYRYAARPPARLLRGEVRDADGPWIALAATLERAKAGDHAGVRAIVRVAGEQRTSLRLRRARLGLIADAGADADLDALAGWMRDGSDDLRVDACWAASLAGAAWLAPAMLEAYARVQGAADREAIGFFISDLLEEEGHLIASAVRGPAPRFEREARAGIARLGTARVPHWFGEEFSVRRLALRMSAQLRAAPREIALTGAFIPLRHKLEAATGIDCSGFFVKGEIAPRAAGQTLDAFLASPAAAEYRPGTRYFFGHPVP